MEAKVNESDKKVSWQGRVRIVSCKNCGKVFETRYLNKLYCCMECRKEHTAKITKKKLEEEKNKKPKIKRMDIVSAIAKVTGLHYGVVSSLYPDIDKILAKAKYEQSIGRAKPIKIDDYRKINISSEHIACFFLGC